MSFSNAQVWILSKVLCFNKTMEHLDKIIIDHNAKKKYTIEMGFELKNQVKFREWNVRGYGGYIVKMFKR